MSNESDRAPDAAAGPTAGSRPPWWLRWSVAALLVFLALHSTSYGTGFLIDPATGAGEFGANTPPTEAAENLAGLVGVILLMLAGTSLVAAILSVRGHRGGGWLTLGLGLSMLGIGAYWATRGRTWDAGFYGSIGFLLAAIAALSLRRAPPSS